MDFLVVCHSLIMSGGLMRFERFGREATLLGHTLTYLNFTGNKPQFETNFEQVDLESAKRKRWDVTMVPGQGFPPETIQQFGGLKSETFGLRVQHVLNDQTFEDGFLRVNRKFDPTVVVFNNQHWSELEQQSFAGNKKLVLEGAVDTRFFAPAVKDRRNNKGRFIIGAQAKREPVTELLKMLSMLPEKVELRLFNHVHKVPNEFQHLVDAGRVKFLGKLSEPQLRDFYHECDCLIHNEKFAGWANIVAEAMACGVPVICTKPGTLALAKHEETALVIERADAVSLVKAVRTVAEHPGKTFKMATYARDHVCNYDWQTYSQKLIEICES